MNIFLIILIVILSIIFVYLSLSLIVIYIMIKKMFGVRNGDPDNPCYVRFEDYKDELQRVPFKTGYYGETIRGYVYSLIGLDKFKGFVVLSHGIASSHVQYLVDIYFLCKDGYKVLAYDQYGCGESDGKCIFSLANGIYVCENVLNDVIKNKLNEDLPIILYGHSWGGYSISGALKKYRNVKACVIRSTFYDPIKEIIGLMKSYIKPLYYLLFPIFRLCFFLLYGKKQMVKTPKIIRKSNVKCFVTQAKNDPVIPQKASLAYYIKKHPIDNTSIYISESSSVHNSLITDEGMTAYENSCKKYEEIKSEPNEEIRNSNIDNFVKSLDRRSLYPYSDTKDKILDFLNKVLFENA